MLLQRRPGHATLWVILLLLGCALLSSAIDLAKLFTRYKRTSSAHDRTTQASGSTHTGGSSDSLIASTQQALSSTIKQAASSLGSPVKGVTTDKESPLPAADDALTMLANTASKAFKDPDLQFIQRMFKGDVHELDLLDYLMDTDGYQHLSQDAAGIRDLAKAFPMMAMVPQLKALVHEELEDDQVISRFATGMTDVTDLMKSTIKTAADTDDMSGVMMEIINDPDPATQSLVEAYTNGDKEAVTQLNKLVHARLFPGMDTSLMDDLTTPEAMTAKFNELRQEEYLMRVLSGDSVMADIMANPTDYFHGAILDIAPSAPQPSDIIADLDLLSAA